jgi:predicted RND superfamily exporter protein
MIVSWVNDASSLGGKITGTNNLWIENRQVKASKVEFMCNFNSDSAASDGIKYQDKWNDYVESMNGLASLTANHAYATADVFKRSEAEVALIGSTIQTIVIASVLAWLSCAVFTGSLKVACLVTGLVLGVVAGLAFFMVVPCDWDIGAIEVLSLVVFMGYAVTYSLHIAHLYTEVGEETKEFNELENTWLERERKRDARRKTKSGSYALGSDDPIVSKLTRLRRSKTRIAVLHVGGATMSSAVSTMGSSVFLLFCTMNIFVKLGAVVIAVTLLSIIFALIPLQALLMECGPKETCFQRFSPDRQSSAWEGNDQGRGLLS